MVGYQEGGKLPPLPTPVVLALAPLITRIERRANHADDGRLRADLAALPAYLDRIDAWIAEGVLGGEPPNAADLQIGATLRLLLTLADVRPLIAARPAGALALALFPEHPGEVPAGTLPAEWVPAGAAPASSPASA
jgi:glutathione S-transferase